MQQLKRWLVTLIVLLAVVAGLGFTKFTQIKAAIAFGESFPEPSETVESIVTQPSEWQPTLELVGEVRATRTVEIRNELEGLITEVGFESGAQVKAGDLLIQLDVSTEKAQLAAIEAQIALAELDVKRFSDLVTNRAGSQDQLDRANAQLAVQKANAAALSATIARRTLIAPFDGATNLHEWEAGAFLSANTLVTTITGNLDTVWVDYAVPQRHASVSKGDAVKVIAKDNFSESLAATVTAISKQINTQTRSLNVRASFDNTQAALTPGSMVTVMVPIKSSLLVYPLPNEALRFDTFGSYVYVIEMAQDGKRRATRRAVEFVGREDGNVFISKGLTTGETIATIGSAKLTQGLWVKLAGAN